MFRWLRRRWLRWYTKNGTLARGGYAHEMECGD